MPFKSNSKNLSVSFPMEVMFYSACQSKDFEDVEAYISKGVDVNYRSSSSLTALHQACIDENFKLCSLLLKNGADPNMKDEEGWSSLHVAASTNNLEIIKLLLKNGALISDLNYDGDFPVELATDENVKNFLNRKMSIDGAERAKIKDTEHSLMLKEAKLWASKGIANNPVDTSSGISFLHVASAKGYTDVVEILVEMNVDLDVQDFDGWTPLHAAVQNNHVGICTILINAGADTSIHTYLGETQRDMAEADLVKILDDLIAKNFQAKKLRDSQSKKHQLVQRSTQQQKTEIKVVDNTNELNQLQSIVQELDPPKEQPSGTAEVCSNYIVSDAIAPISSIKSKGLRHRLRVLDQFHRMVENDDSLFSLHKTHESTMSPISRSLEEEDNLTDMETDPTSSLKTGNSVFVGLSEIEKSSFCGDNKNLSSQNDFEDNLLANSVPYRLRIQDKESAGKGSDNCCSRCSKLKKDLEELRAENEMMNAKLSSFSMTKVSEDGGKNDLKKMVDYLDRICRLEDENRRLFLENNELRGLK